MGIAEIGGDIMSAPGIDRSPRQFSLPGISSVTELPKPLKALVYLAMLALLTVAGVGALLATVVIIGQLTGSFDVAMFIGR
ncbi:hypothetical protein SAMN04489718_2007 [Actinopolyspora saharensis]|uniref:Uncharacterized protein n=2 Tax=Actinopolysporaceae TaxID=622451 RepID=A0A1H1DCP5_9ACTN|nr:hypothetical protein SAMN04489718_2007 [Actinopolyspora saharensis]